LKVLTLLLLSLTVAMIVTTHTFMIWSNYSEDQLPTNPIKVVTDLTVIKYTVEH